MTSELEKRRIAFIGAGAMMQALAGGLIEAGVASDRLCAADPDREQRRRAEERLGLETYASNAEAVARSDLVVLAVKPGVVPAALEELAGAPGLDQRLWISIAAGVSLARVEAALPSGARVIRAMPNTPALVGAGATALCANAAATPEDRAAAEALFRAVGITWEAPEEGLLDAVTGLSGSGPAYVFVILEALGDAGVHMGLPRDAAYRLALQTVYGAAKMALESDLHPASLKDQVTSPGGTTVAGLERLEALGVRVALQEAVAAATRRSRELGRA